MTIFSKIVLPLQRGLDFWDSGVRSWEPRSIKNRSKNEFNMGRHLGIDFKSILMDFGTQLGIPNGPKIDPRRIKEDIEKTKEITVARRGGEHQSRGLEGSRRGFGRFWLLRALPDAFWADLGRVLWAIRGQLGPNLGPKMLPKSNKHRWKTESKIN